jgi:hypothetical protein
MAINKADENEECLVILVVAKEDESAIMNDVIVVTMS